MKARRRMCRDCWEMFEHCNAHWGPLHDLTQRWYELALEQPIGRGGLHVECRQIRRYNRWTRKRNRNSNEAWFNREPWGSAAKAEYHRRRR